MKYVFTEEYNQSVNMDNMSVLFNINENGEKCSITSVFNGAEKPTVRGNKKNTIYKNEFILAEIRLSFNADDQLRKKIAKDIFAKFMEAFQTLIESQHMNLMSVYVKRKDLSINQSDALEIHLGKKVFSYEPDRFTDLEYKRKPNNSYYNKRRR